MCDAGMQPLNGLTRLLKHAVRRCALNAARFVWRDARIYTDLFVEPYATWADWKSGLGSAALHLYVLARTLQPRVVVEIGSSRGRSTCTLAFACRKNGQGKVYAIDPHAANPWMHDGTAGSYEFLRRRVADYRLDAHCEIIRATSREAAKDWRKPIDLLFVDGDHSYDGVRHDFEAFGPFVRRTGLILFHDGAWEHARGSVYYRPDMGVPRFLDELQRQGYESVTLLPAPGLTIMHPRVGGFEFVPDRPSPNGIVRGDCPLRAGGAAR